MHNHLDKIFEKTLILSNCEIKTNGKKLKHWINKADTQ